MQAKTSAEATLWSKPVIIDPEETASHCPTSGQDLCLLPASHEGESLDSEYEGFRHHGAVDGWNAARVQKAVELCIPMFQMCQTAQE